MRKKVLFLCFALSGFFCIGASLNAGENDLRPEILILCAGDSITSGGYPQNLEKFFVENGFQNVKVVNLGRPGNTSGEYLKFLRHSKSWRSPFPDWVLLQLGTNDVRIDGDHTTTPQFEKNMEAILALFQTEARRQNRKVQIALATIPPVCVSRNFDEGSIKRVVDEVNPKIREIAAKHQLLVIDNYDLFFKNPHLLPEIHPTPEGYSLMAQNWFHFLKSHIKEK
jgi:lysophospholipase L1-like esterase